MGLEGWRLSRTELRELLNKYERAVEDDAYFLVQPSNAERQLLGPDLLQRRITAVRQARDQNRRFLEQVLEDLPDIFAGPDAAVPPARPVAEFRSLGNGVSTLPSSSYGSLASVFLHLMRDWSALCEHVISVQYGPVVQEIKEILPKGSQVLLPGAGLGRLALMLASEGFQVEANDASRLFLTFADYILNREAACLLALLSELGLVGGMLAVSHGTEHVLARQLAERLGLENKPWHLEFITGQVREAVQMADLEERLVGSSSTRSMQNLLDARAAIEKEKVKTLEPPSTQVLLPAVPKRGTLGRTVRLRSGRVASEEEVNDKVMDKLVDELVRYKAPILEEIRKAMNPVRAKEALIGKYRFSTVRRYLASWERFREWADALGKPGQRPNSVTLVDYMYAREEEGMGASIPLAVSTAVAWFEKTAGTPEDEMLMNQQFLQLVMKELTRKLEMKAPPVRRCSTLEDFRDSLL
ncbi:Carnosine N-methyltransferase [Durusdinium trenchii]|uniref:carnosine N-methyltransferase n=1 Tax=Durusdinium trenchii TaxID=1381693 RepID=A0ABP0JMQ0_9DINO